MSAPRNWITRPFRCLLALLVLPLFLVAYVVLAVLLPDSLSYVSDYMILAFLYFFIESIAISLLLLGNPLDNASGKDPLRWLPCSFFLLSIISLCTYVYFDSSYESIGMYIFFAIVYVAIYHWVPFVLILCVLAKRNVSHTVQDYSYLYDDDDDDEEYEEEDDEDIFDNFDPTRDYYGRHGEFDTNDESRRVSEDIQGFHNNFEDSDLLLHYHWDEVLDA